MVAHQWRRNEFESGGHRSGAKVGGTDPAQSARKNFLVVPLHLLALKAQLVVSVSTFVMVSTVWSVSCLLFFYSLCPPPCPAICKHGGGHVPHGVGTTGGHSFLGDKKLGLFCDFESFF